MAYGKEALSRCWTSRVPEVDVSVVVATFPFSFFSFSVVPASIFSGVLRSYDPSYPSSVPSLISSIRLSLAVSLLTRNIFASSGSSSSVSHDCNCVREVTSKLISVILSLTSHGEPGGVDQLSRISSL